MKKGLRKIICAVVALCAALPCAVSPVFANSGHRYEYGITGSGAVIRNEESVLAVEHEKLTFDIHSFPDYPDISGYDSTVTAEYTFVNTSENTVTTSMAFPIESDPYCSGDALPPVITLNGEEIEVETRHTYGGYYYFEEGVKDIYDGFYEDDFYKPDTMVTEYIVKVGTRRNDLINLTGRVTCGDGARFMAGGGNSEKSIWFHVNDYHNTATFYVFGDPDDFACEWSCEEYKEHLFKPDEYVPCDRTVTVTKTRETTLKEFALEYREADCAVSEVDWYNAIVTRFYFGKDAGYDNRDLNVNNFTKWYLYDITLSAGESVVNTVTAPIFPRWKDSYSPDVYIYRYYLSPAQSWQSFGTLEIEINTDYYEVFTSSVDFTEREGGYVAELDGLPESELTFTLCSAPDPKTELGSVGVTLLVIVLVILFIALIFTLGPVIFAIVYLIKSRKKK